ncbi:adenosine deaminase family protein [Neofusicoccum parvum]|uniref:Adenosine deaminase family protein n=1 Tax=Neofusicoccum parvum TaxID=310453 RepID=A0ACB5RRN6_9PEZI|nr:adenosine deaminase family protein [Neofusicoccum parvum]
MDRASVLDDDQAWLQQEGVPQLEDQFIQKYLDGRDKLVDEEKKQRSDRFFRESLSPTAFEACSIVDQIRFEEQQTLWTKDYENSLSDDGDVFPGMMFSLAKQRMEKSKLWQIVRRMPKGALLHCHLEAMVDLDWMLDEAFKLDGIHVWSDRSLSNEADLAKAPFFFTYTKLSKKDSASIWSESYAGKTPIPLDVAAASFPHGGREGFTQWVKSRTMITSEESLKHHYGVNDVWRKFASCFPILASLIFYEPFFRKYMRKMFENLYADGVQWVDVRAVFVTPWRPEGSEEVDTNHDGFFKAFGEEIEKFNASEQGKGFWGARFIWTTPRIFDKRRIVESMKMCVETKVKFPHLIGGYDLVGQEDTGRPLQDLLPELFWFKKRCMESGVDVPFFFHAGETLGDGDTTDENLFDAVLLGTRRIGHGFSLFKHPLLIDMIKQKKILIESCPVSNEVLRLTGSIMSHPLPALLARGVNVSLCNDDPSILGQGTSGMTHDFWQALQGWENLGLAGLGALAENSVRWANFEDCSQKEWLQDIKEGALGKGIRAQRLKQWMADWEKFCQWIVTEYGVDEDLDPEE